MSVYKEEIAIVETAIDSILGQTYENFEIIVLLDCPEYDEMRSYLSDIEKTESRLKFYVNNQNMGLLFSLNRGISLCNGELICRMDADDFSEPSRIAKQVDFLVKKKLDLVGSYTSLMDSNGMPTGKIRKYPSNEQSIGKLLRYMNVIPHPTWLLKKSVYEELGGYRNINYAEDYDFLIRATMNGFKVGVYPEALLRYRVNPIGITQSNIASQKIVSACLAHQLDARKIYSEEQIASYRKQKAKEEKKLTVYYALWKKWKQRERLTCAEICKMIFNVQNIREVRQRAVYKWICIQDGRRYGDC